MKSLDDDGNLDIADIDEGGDVHHDGTSPRGRGLGRRDLIKLGAGVVVTALNAPTLLAQRGGGSRGPVPPKGSARPAGELRPHTGPGYTNDYDRLDGNGPMDDTTRTIVKFVHGYKASDMSPTTLKMANRTMVDSMAAAFAGFEEEAIRISARLARQVQSTEHGLKSTVFGYGITTTPELASFVNSGMVRLVDFNDTPHDSNLIPAALAIGRGAPLDRIGGDGGDRRRLRGHATNGGGDSVAPAMAAGKLMGLDEDRLANA